MEMDLSSNIHSESQIVADGLAIDLVNHFDLTYQTIPDYDNTENVLASWEGDECAYFISFSKLPPGWLDADVWIGGFTRDINSASEGRSLKIFNRGHYKSKDMFVLSFVEISYIPRGENDEIFQLVNFITDKKNSYLAFATSVADGGKQKIQTEVTTILETSHKPASNIVPLIRKNEDKYIGFWVGDYFDNKGNRFEIAFDLKDDLTFARRTIANDGDEDVYTGVWSVNNDALIWTYLYGKPSSGTGKSEDIDTIEIFDGTTLVINSNGIQITLQRTDKLGD